jgi:hypothetical protein
LADAKLRPLAQPKLGDGFEILVPRPEGSDGRPWIVANQQITAAVVCDDVRVTRRNFWTVGLELNVVSAAAAERQTVIEINLVVGMIRPINTEQERRRALN